MICASPAAGVDGRRPTVQPVALLHADPPKPANGRRMPPPARNYRFCAAC